MLRPVRRNPQFARLWLAQLVSQSGDWLNRVACMVLIGELGGAAAALGLGALFGAELTVRLLPSALLGPVAGPIADRFPRRLLMVAADLSRAAVVLGLLLVHEPEHLPLLYGLLVVQMAIGIFFDAARTGALPDTVTKEDLPDAYALTAATWSLTLCLGSLAGGWLVHWIGVSGAFVFDAATYVASSLFLVGLRLPAVPVHPEPFRWRDVAMMKDLARGFAHVRERGVTSILWAKTFWGAAGGYLVLLSLAGRDRFGIAEGGATGALGAHDVVGATAVATGALYAARGVGTGVGPFLANRLLGRSDAALRRQISAGFATAAVGYALFGFSTSLPLACFFVAVAHLGGSTIWVASSVLWQRHVADAFRGRVFALEFLSKDLAFVAGGLLGGAVYDASGSLGGATAFVSTLVLLLGGTWTWLARRARIPEAEAAAPETAESPARRGW